MLTIKQITDNTDAVIRGLEKKHFKNAKETIEQVLETNNKRRNTQTILDEEAILLSYALSSWERLNSLKKAGLICRHFRAMIPVSDKSKVQVVPLNRLAYEYLDRIIPFPAGT